MNSVNSGPSSFDLLLERLRNAPDDNHVWRDVYPVLYRVALLEGTRGLRGDTRQVREWAHEAIVKLYLYVAANTGAVPTDGARFRAYFKAIVRSSAIDALRRGSRSETTYPLTDEIGFARTEEADSETVELFLAEHDRMGSPDKEILELLLCGYRHREIAEELGLRPATIAVRLLRFRRRFDKLLISKGLDPTQSSA